jgi:hypothetical protein
MSKLGTLAKIGLFLMAWNIIGKWMGFDEE